MKLLISTAFSKKKACCFNFCMQCVIREESVFEIEQRRGVGWWKCLLNKEDGDGEDDEGEEEEKEDDSSK